MGKSRRLIFTFDEKSYEGLERLKERGKYASLAEAVRDSLLLARAIQEQESQGFSEIVVRKPGANVERVLVGPVLCAGKDN